MNFLKTDGSDILKVETPNFNDEKIISLCLAHKNALSEIDKLQERLKEAEEVIQFYANESFAMQDYPYDDDYSLVCKGNFGVEVCGKRARDYQKKYLDKKGDE